MKYFYHLIKTEEDENILPKKMKIFKYEIFHMKNSNCELFPNYGICLGVPQLSTCMIGQVHLLVKYKMISKTTFKPCGKPISSLKCLASKLSKFNQFSPTSINRMGYYLRPVVRVFIQQMLYGLTVMF